MQPVIRNTFTQLHRHYSNLARLRKYEGEFKVGSDPECFIVDNKGNIANAQDYIEGSKHSPHKTEHGFILPDNVAAEFNPNAAASASEFEVNTKLCLTDLSTHLKKYKLKPYIVPAIELPEALRYDPRLLEAGCEPDFNAYTFSENPRPELGTLRAAGGHLHISFSSANDNELNRAYLVRALDIILGLPSVIIDDDTQRRSIYGKAGCCRYKFTEYGHAYDGVEYRSLSNFWVARGMYKFIWNGVHLALSRKDTLENRGFLDGDFSNGVIEAINTSNRQLADSLLTDILDSGAM